MVFPVDFEMLIFKRPFESELNMNWHVLILILHPSGVFMSGEFTSPSQKFPEMVAFLIKKSLKSDSFHL